MRLKVTEDFVKVTVSAGIIQNMSSYRNVEVASIPNKNTGIVLQPFDKLQFDSNVTVYARTVGKDECIYGDTYLAIEPFKSGGKGGDCNPVGTIIAFVGNGSLPDKYLLCDGSALSRETYATLFSVIGTSFGKGNGSTTFNLPNLIGRFLEGNANAGTVKLAGLPNITGWVTYAYGVYRSLYGAFYSVAQNGTGSSASYPNVNLAQTVVYFSASNSNGIYGNSSTVQPPAVTTRFLIKYE